mgnify:CR=1 FL=1
MRSAKNENGQALIFSIMAALFLIVPIMMVYNVGHVVKRRIRIQNSADAAALAGAQVEADILSTIAWINNGMSVMYGHATRRIVDVNTYATMAALVEHGEFCDEPLTTAELNDGTDGNLSPEQIKAKYEEVWENADEWVPKCRDWITVLSKIEHSLALITPDLVEMEVLRTASANAMQKELACGLNFTTYYKKFEMDTTVSNADLFIRRLEGAEEGWEISCSNGDHIKVLHLSENKWEIQNLANGNWILVERINEDHYRVESFDQDGHHGPYIFNPREGTVVTPENEVTITPRDDGGVTITFPDGHSIGILIDEETGQVHQDTDGDGDYDEVLGSETSNGLRVDNVSNIDLGDAQIESFNPIRVHFHKMWITMWMNGTVNIGANIAPYVTVSHFHEDDYLQVNSLRTDRADGRWRQYWDSNRIRHRMTELDAGSEWDYEYNLRMIGNFLAEDDKGEYGNGRFGAFHSVYDQTARFSESYNAYSPPQWLRYTREDHDAVYADSQGWFDTRAGSVAMEEVAEGLTRQMFHQTRDCWHDTDEEQTGFWIKQVTDEESGSTYVQLILCPVCYYSGRYNRIPDLPDFPSPPAPYTAVWDNIPDPGDAGYKPLAEYSFDVEVFNNANSSWNSPRDAWDDENDRWIEDTALNTSIPHYVYEAYGDSPPADADLPDVTVPDRMDNDGNGRSDIRKYPADAANPLSDTYANLVNWVKQDEFGSYDLYMSFNWDGIRKPLVLTEDFFKYGTVNVAIWQPPENRLFVMRRQGVESRGSNELFRPGDVAMTQAEELGADQDTISRDYIFDAPEWGVMATASARIAMRYTDMDGNIGFFSRAGELEWLDDLYPHYEYDGSITLEEETDLRRRRQIFARRYFANLVDPKMSAVLIPTYESIRSEDIDADVAVDTGTNYLYKMLLLEAEARINYFHSGSTWGSHDLDLIDKFHSMRYREDGGHLNVSHQDIAEMITH